MKGNMKKQIVEYKGKKMKIPYVLAKREMSTEMVTRQNPFSGESIQLPRFAAEVYDTCVGLNLMCEKLDRSTKQEPGFSKHQNECQLVRDGINFFRQYFAEEYMVLLD